MTSATVAWAQTENTPASQTIKGYEVEFKGAGEQAGLLKKHLDISRHAKSDITIEELQRLVGVAPRQIQELLATEGYFSPKVEHTLVQKGGRWVARFEVNPGRPTTVESVDLSFSGNIAEGNRHTQRVQRLKRQWSLTVNEQFTQNEWSSSKNTVLKNLLTRNYPAAQLSASEAKVDPERYSARLQANYDSGPPFTFGELNIHGLERYPRSRIEDLNPIRRGDPYSQEKLNELQSRIQNSGYFRSAFATVEIDPAKPDQVPVRVDVTELERKVLGLGVGVSSDSGAHLKVKWLDRNFLERDWRLESELQVDRQTQKLGADIYLPPLRGDRLNGWLPSYGAHYERTDIRNVQNNKIRTSARLSSPNKKDEKAWALFYLADRERIEDRPSYNRQALLANFSYTRRRIDSLVQPRRGYIAGADISAGPKGLINKANIGRVVLTGTGFYPITKRWQTVVRGQVGQVFGGDRRTVPSDLLFRTGGDQTVRGYGYESLGVADGNAIVGGTVLAVLSAEVVYNITSEWGAAVFTDAGNAADSWSDFGFQHGSGIGARWRSPIGPVNLDLAYGHETEKVRLHFSIGYGF